MFSSSGSGKHTKSILTDPDISDATPMASMLHKKAPFGWHDRFFYLNNNLLVHKHKETSPSSDVKQTLVVTDIESISITNSKDLEIKVLSGETLIFKCDNSALASSWISAINERKDWASSEERVSLSGGTSKSLEVETSGCTHMNGILKKKSSHGTWHDRYFFLNNNLLAHKHNINSPDSDVKISCEISLIDEINLDDKLQLEIKLTKGATQTFKCPDLKSGDLWMSAINERMDWSQSLFDIDLTTTSDAICPEGCVHMEGVLKKQSGHGTWHRRYFYLTENKLVHKHKKLSPQSDVKVTFNVAMLESINIIAETDLEIKLTTGESYTYKCSNSKVANDWKNALFDRHKWTSSAGVAGVKNLSGWLLKKGNSKLKNMQPRFVRLDGIFLRYFKKETDKDDSGNINLEEAEFIRRYGDAEDCKQFEIMDKSGRVFLFEATNTEEMVMWLTAIDTYKIVAKEELETKIAAQIYDDTPIRIRMFDEDGQESFMNTIRLDFLDIYPISDEDNEFSLAQHMKYADELVEYLLDFIPECSKTKDRRARYDILSLVMTECNYTLTSRMFGVLQTDSEELVSASLGDIHSLIVWITQYQQTMRKTKCPIPSPKQGQRPMESPTFCGIFESLPILCERYVNGDPDGKGGAASGIVDHCIKVWESLLRNPADMVQQHSDGSFFTHTPVGMWEALHQHLSLATATKSPVLHVIVANKIAAALKHIIFVICEYMKKFDTSNDPELKEIELEFLCAMANDNALHIEEIMNVVENFDMNEIRAKINNIFDTVTVELVVCGQECLKRLVTFVMTDVNTSIVEVFTNSWLEGNQVQVTIATIGDYLSDFESFLMPFWSKKFVNFLLESVTIEYTRAVIFRPVDNHSNTREKRKEYQIKRESEIEASKNQSKISSTFSSFFGKKKEESEIAQGSDSYGGDDDEDCCLCGPESLGRLQQDVNSFFAFFQKHIDADSTELILSLLNEVSYFLIAGIDELTKKCLERIMEFPSSAKAILDVFNGCMDLRDDIDDEEFQEALMMIQPSLTRAQSLADQYEIDSVAEGLLGHLFILLVPINSNDTQSKANSFTQKMRDMAHLPSINLSLGDLFEDEYDEYDQEEEEEDKPKINRNELTQEQQEELERRRKEAISSSTGDLVDDVLDIINSIDEDNLALDAYEEEEKIKIEEFKRTGFLKYEGYLEKLSPSMLAVWQSRYFKLISREQFDDETGESFYVYSLMWFKKSGGEVLKSAQASNIKTIRIMESNRSFCFNITKGNILMLATEAKAEDSKVDIKPEKHTKDKYNVFKIILNDRNEHLIRCTKVDVFIKWINILSTASKLSYSETECNFNKQAKIDSDTMETEVRNERLRKEAEEKLARENEAKISTRRRSTFSQGRKSHARGRSSNLISNVNINQIQLNNINEEDDENEDNE
jgi:hypothetical protein